MGNPLGNTVGLQTESTQKGDFEIQDVEDRSLNQRDLATVNSLKGKCLLYLSGLFSRNCELVVNEGWAQFNRVVCSVFEMTNDVEIYSPTFVNEPAALQTLFDIEWLKVQLKFSECCPKESKASLSMLLSGLLETHIDPVNWALLEKQFKQNVSESAKNSELLFLTSTGANPYQGKLTTRMKKGTATPSTFIPFNSTIPRIPLLPIPSTMRASRKTMGRRAMLNVKNSLKRTESSNLRSSKSNNSENVRDKAFAKVSQVGSNLLSQASSWGLFN
mmetsp:Transcript_14800/g.17919  ORF Transcript_14800/g.17919 Transcript_14800/m.17919 type:complete len:274 (-) Transcript_14800:1512-2333(-)